MDKKKDEIYDKISESLEERGGKERRQDAPVEEFINSELERRQLDRRTVSAT